MAKQKKLTVALAGNPNTGKTTIFNRLTGARQKVGNYSGVTVKKISGILKLDQYELELVDLPGTYSLTAYAEDELVARDFLLNNRPDIILNICDAAGLERSLYLTVQLRELDIPMISILNKWDLAEKNQLRIDTDGLQSLFATPFVKVVGDKGNGFDKLTAELKQIIENPPVLPSPPFRFAAEVDNEINEIENAVKKIPGFTAPAHPRWLAIKLLENDRDILERFKEQQIADDHPLIKLCNERRNHLEAVFGEECEIIMVEERYGIIRGAMAESTPAPAIRAKLDLSDRLDKIFLNRIFGLPVFAVLMFLIFYIPFHLGEPLTGLVDSGFTWLGDTLRGALAPGFWRGLIVDGIIGGLGGVLVFVPQILLLFACISFLEATGYMARAAFVVDRFMHKLGLHGKSFVPLIIGFGCSVPALLATRSLDNRQDRLTTMMAIPFMSCSARLPVYVLFLGAFFPPDSAGLVLFTLYLFGIVIAVITAKLLRKFVYKGEQSHFVMELPPFRMPTLTGILHQMWEKAWLYLKKAGTLLLAASALLWILTNYPRPDSSHFNRQQKAVDSLTADFTNRAVALAQTTPGSWRFGVDYKLQHSAWSNYLHRRKKLNGELFKQLSKLEESAGAQKLRVYYQGRIAQLQSNQQPQIVAAASRYLKLRRTYEQQLAKVRGKFNVAQKKHSVAGSMGTLLAPVLAPLGLDDWRIGVALVSGFAAKEVIVSTLGTIYGLGEDDIDGGGTLRKRLQKDKLFLKDHPFPRQIVNRKDDAYFLGSDRGRRVFENNGKFYLPDYLTVISLLVFVLLYVPCQAATIVFIKEAGWKNGLFMVVYTTGAAWLMSMLVYQSGRLLGL